MAEVIWWKKENWYESKSVPLFSFFLSPREIVLISSSGFAGFVLSFAVPIYYLKIAVVFVFAAAGGFLSAFPSKTVPFELAVLAQLLVRKKSAKVQKAPHVIKPEVHDVPSSVPLVITGELRPEKPVEAVLFVDGHEVAKALVTRESPGYRLYFVPEDRGAHEITVKAGEETLETITVNVV
ncbi:MAG: hypothetical protein RAK25_04685 [TACK group archaeon]|nr:hypothetical protein [TACK group archaeon]